MTDFLYAGIDGGGTKCRVRLSDARGTILGEGFGGPANIRLAPELVWHSVFTALDEAAAAAKLSETDFTRTHVGMGAAGAGQSSSLKRFLSRPHPFASLAVETDAHTTWLGAFSGSDGAILIVGTGSCGYGNIAGSRYYVGGLGYEISDEGSGAAMGRDALRHAVWTIDGRASPTALSKALLEEFQNDPEILVDWVGQARGRDYARFAPLILDHANRRDPLGLAIVQKAADDLAQMAERLLDLGAPALCLSGGLAEALRSWLPQRIQRALAVPVGDALDGALLLARAKTERIMTDAR